MFRKIVLGLALAATATLVPSVGAATTTRHNSARLHRPRPKGFYFHAGLWRPYRGPGYPYRGGYYDRRGRWHRA